MSNFERASELLFGTDASLEGPYKVTDDERDPGGETVCGVTKTLCTAIGEAFPPSIERVGEIYKRVFYLPYWCDKLIEPADAVYLQLVVDTPSSVRVRCLQSALRVFVDGQRGPITLAAIQSATDGFALGERLLSAQTAHYQSALAAHSYQLQAAMNRVAKVSKWLLRV